jgi:hypothetical protein
MRFGDEVRGREMMGGHGKWDGSWSKPTPGS